MSKNIVWHESQVSRAMREKNHGHRSAVLWFTGLSGSGKSTLAHAIEKELYDLKVNTFVFDGDNVRHGLCKDLGFSEEDREENIRRIGEMASLFVEAGVFSLTAFISPFRNDRDSVRELMKKRDFIEVYCRCCLDVCEERDVKGLYRRARAGEITDFTGISSPYEEPENPEMVVDTDKQTLDECVAQVIEFLEKNRYLPDAA
ncbi:MAG: adenylyl-sulfate kinase [Mariprofundaceae bacterium]